MTRTVPWLRRHLAALRMLLVLTLLLGIVYPLAITAIAQAPGLRANADGSLLSAGRSAAGSGRDIGGGDSVGSTLSGQSFTDRSGAPLRQYFQSRPSAAGGGYDPTASGGSNLGPQSVVDTLPDPTRKGAAGVPSLLSLVCARSLSVGRLEGVSGARPYCTSTGVGAVLGVTHRSGGSGPVSQVVSLNQECPAVPFVSTWDGVRVRCATFGVDYSRAVIVVVRGNAPERPVVPSDAVTASGSGLDPQISVAYARLQAPRVARARGVTVTQVLALVAMSTTDRALGFMGEPVVDVLQLNVALDLTCPYQP